MYINLDGIVIRTQFRERNIGFIVVKSLKKAEINSAATIFSVVGGAVREKNVRIGVIKEVINAYAIGI